MTTDNKVQEPQELWDKVLSEIELNISKANFTTWFKKTHLIKEEGGVVYVGVPNGFVKEWINKKYHTFILKTLRVFYENVRGVEYIVVARSEKQEQIEDGLQQKTASSNELPLKDLYVNKEDNLNPRYMFDSFVVGPFNELAHAAALAVVKNPGLTYNPLFIYGGTGLGKTHLLQAVGNKIKETKPDKKVFYTTSEKFFIDYINSVQANKISVFKEKYRKYDVFIMDDVQFFSGKQGTQDELFHNFNTLYDNNKQIIFSSDKHYNYIPDLEDRLRSRFGAGMIVDISDPDFETRVAILRTKAKVFSFSVSDDLVEYIASSTSGSIRELEGIFNAIVCQAQLKNRELSLNEIKAILKNNEKPRRSVSPEEVIEIVSDFYNIERNSIYEKTRRKEIVRPRQIVMYILREDFGVSYPTIGQKLGGRDHTTVIHSCEKIRTEINENGALLREVDQIRSMF